MHRLSRWTVCCMVGFAPWQGVPAIDPDDPCSDARQKMVRTQIAARGVTDSRVLQAMAVVPRHEFVPEPLRPTSHQQYRADSCPAR